MWDWVKEHKLIVIGAVAVIMIIWLVSRSKGSSSGAALDTSQASASSDALQAAQIQANAQSNQVAAAVQSNQDTIGGQLALAQIQANAQANANDIAQNVALKQLDAQKDVTMQSNTLAFASQQSHDYYQTAQLQQAAYYQTAQQSTMLNTLAAISMHNTDARR